ncbi:hypothetical protein A8B75_03555 [Sphingomonadales bacterium EhC05]|nr:hypothetical protein A8B75_03555 [Sphingomonadales bacterium EhC05]
MTLDETPCALGSAEMNREEKISDIVQSLQFLLDRLDELELRVPAVKIAESIEILISSSRPNISTKLTEVD